MMKSPWMGNNIMISSNEKRNNFHNDEVDWKNSDDHILYTLMNFNNQQYPKVPICQPKNTLIQD